jgi:ATP-dependent Clp protease protease subunit
MQMPYVWTPQQRGGSYVDLATYLHGHRTLFLGPELTSDAASVAAMQLLALTQEEGDISLYINCYGGSVPAGLAIVDLLDYASERGHTVRTYCLGECIGIAAAILVAGTPRHRKAFPSARISLFQEWFGTESLWGADRQDTDERTRLKRVVREIFAARTPIEERSETKLDTYLDELTFFSGTKARELGIVDDLCETLPHAGREAADAARR